jgi:hypothetical protein
MGVEYCLACYLLASKKRITIPQRKKAGKSAKNRFLIEEAGNGLING